jgi:hypothetical protein
MDQSWVTLEALNTPVRQNNVSFLQSCDHELISLIQQNPQSEKLVFQRHTQYIQCRTSTSPAVTIVNGNDVPPVMNAIRKWLQPLQETKNCLVMIGSKIGYNLAAVLPEILRNKQLILVIVEPTIDRIIACLSLVDLQQAFATERVHFVCSNINEEDIVKQLTPLNLRDCGGIQIYCSSEIEPQINPETLQKLFKEHAVQNKRQLEQLKTHLSESRGTNIKKVLFVNCWQNAPGEVHIKTIEQYLRKRGIQTETLVVNRYRFNHNPKEHRRVLEQRMLNTIQQFQPNLVLSYAYHAPLFVSQEVFESLNIKWVQVVTNVAHYDEEQYEGEYTFLLEKHLIPLFQQRGYQKMHHLPLAADYTSSIPVQPSHQMPIVFVGNSFGLPPQSIQALMQQWKDKPQLLEYVKDAIVELGDFDKQRHIYEYMQQQPIPQVDTEKEKYDAFRYIYCQATAQRRVTLLEKLAPLGLVLFGGDWNSVLPQHSPIRQCLRGVLPVHEEPKIFAHGSIFINLHTIGHVTGPNMRFFNVPGMGAFQICDANCFDVFFNPDEEMVFARSINEYADKIQYYLSHKTEMDAIRIAGYERVKRDWTYEQWIDKVFRMIAD